MKIGKSGERVIVAIDVGTTKICVLVAHYMLDKSLNIIGIGRSPSHGVARGVVVDIAQAVQSIKSAVREAELMAGCKIDSAYVGISGSHIQSLNSSGMVPIKYGKVRKEDVIAVLSAAQAVVIPEGHQILHILPQFFCIDSQQKIKDPIGMHGVRLEAQVHIVTGSVASVQNLVSCCNLAGIEVTDLALEQLASAQAVLSEDEKELGVALVDIGGGTSDFAVYQQGAIKYTKVFGIAGNHVTHDIALCLRTTLKDAERIKKEFGSSVLYNSSNMQFEAEMVHGQDKQNISVQDLSAIIEPRIQELMQLVRKEIIQQQLEQHIPSGVIFTGGGSLLDGLVPTAEALLQLPVRVGMPHVPQQFKQLLENPSYATSYGLLLHVIKNSENSTINALTGPLITRILWRMKSWISDFF